MNRSKPSRQAIKFGRPRTQSIVVSLFGGIIFVANASNGMSYLGWLFAIGASIQGMMLIGPAFPK
jgi:hypothetical protein